MCTHWQTYTHTQSGIHRQSSEQADSNKQQPAWFHTAISIDAHQNVRRLCRKWFCCCFIILLWFAILARLVLRYVHVLQQQRQSSSFLACRVRMMFLICDFFFFHIVYKKIELRFAIWMFCCCSPRHAIRWFRSIVIYLIFFFYCLPSTTQMLPCRIISQKVIFQMLCFFSEWFE